MRKLLITAVMLAAAVSVTVMPVSAREKKIQAGIYAEDIDLSGLTLDEAKSKVGDYVASFGNTHITLNAIDGGTIETTAAELGLKWGNPSILDEATDFGRDGDILQCYKELKDLEHQQKVYPIEMDFDKNKIKALIAENAGQYNQEAVNATMTREGGSFTIQKEQAGVKIDETASADAVYDYLMNSWDGTDCAVDLVIVVDEPTGKAEELAKVKDVLGTYTTSFSSSGTSRSANVSNGCRLIDGTTLFPGEEFSTYEAVSPFSQANGYYMAGSYLRSGGGQSGRRHLSGIDHPV